MDGYIDDCDDFDYVYDDFYSENEQEIGKHTSQDNDYTVLYIA